MERRFFSTAFAAAVIVILAVGSTPQVLAHAGHDKAPGEEGEVAAGGPITITSEAKANLALKVEDAELRTLEKSFMVIGQIEAMPSRSAAVTSRISGRVADIKVNEGEMVKRGQPVVEVESRQVGNPPPRVTYQAPIDGVVTRREAVLNGAVEPDKNLLEIVDTSEVFAEGQIFEGQLAQVKIGQKVRVGVESFPGDTFTGTVELIGGALDPETRTLKVWVRVPNTDARLRPNMRATLHIVTDAAESVVAIPHSAVLGEAGNLFAFAQTDKEGLVYERRAVVTGIKDDQYVEIIEGIFPGDKVVTLGNYQLQYVSPKPKADEHGKAESAPHEHGTATASSWWSWKWIGIGILALLTINAVVLVTRRRRAETDYITSRRATPAVHEVH